MKDVKKFQYLMFFFLNNVSCSDKIVQYLHIYIYKTRTKKRT